MNLTAYRLLIEFSLEDLIAKLQEMSVTVHPERVARLARFIEKLTRLYAIIDAAWEVRSSEELMIEHWKRIKKCVQGIMREYAGNDIHNYDRKLNVVVQSLRILAFDKLGVPEEERGFAG
jgi:hypothetical protein